MSEAIISALNVPGLWFVAVGALIAGIVRGFSGFGTAMIYLPFAAQVMPPVWAIITLVTMDIFGPMPLVRSALREAHKRDLTLLLVGLLALMPVGLALLSLISSDTYRYFVSGLSLALLTALIFGLRYRGALSAKLIAGVGGLAGFSAGLSGVAGPPVILFYMASTLPVRVVRANVLLFLFFSDFLMLGILGLHGALVATPLFVGLLLAIPNAIGNLLGAAVFNPDKAGVYTSVAYVVVGASALMGLPFWGG